MKRKFLCLGLLLSGCVLFSSCYATENDTCPANDVFSARVSELTGLRLYDEKITENLTGYKIPVFPDSEKNRNHFDERPEGASINSLVMHYTVSDLFDTLALFTKDIPTNRVSATYVIGEPDQHLGVFGGEVIRVTPEEKRAWHAGVSKWKNLVNLNGTSIGIENVNKGFIDLPSKPGAWFAFNKPTRREWFPFDPNQIRSLGFLSQSIVKRYNISPACVVAHADIAPDRKQDPGILFPWGQLHNEYGVGAWLTEKEQDPSVITQLYSPREKLPQGVNVAFLSTYLGEYGYDIAPTAYADEKFLNVLKAFKAHFSQNQHPEKYDGLVDMTDMLWGWGLAAKYK